MLLETCPTCHNNDWERIEGKKFFSCKPCREKKISQQEEIEAEKKFPQQQKNSEQEKNSCSLCGSNDWWSPIGTPLQRICWACQLPSSRALVGVRFFFDDAGKKWLITNNSDGSETWEMEANAKTVP